MLIADDDPAIVQLLAERCTKMGFNVETAANGMQLLLKARRNHPDIMIVDVNMPEMDGLSVCTRLLDPGSKPVEVVVVTGSSDPETAERCESLGLFYGRKGPEFWNNIEAALTEIYPDMAGEIERQELPATGAPVHERPRVLVVDDDPAVQKFLASRLAKFGIDTLYASDAVHAYRIAYQGAPERHRHRQFHAGRRRPVSAASPARHAGNRENSRHRDQRPSAGRNHRADAAARDPRSSGGDEYPQEIVRYR